MSEDNSRLADQIAKAEVTRLNELARLYPWRLFGIGELAKMIGVCSHVVRSVAARSDGPFPAKSRKSRPEKVTEWLLNPPPDFDFPSGKSEDGHTAAGGKEEAG